MKTIVCRVIVSKPMMHIHAMHMYALACSYVGDSKENATYQVHYGDGTDWLITRRRALVFDTKREAIGEYDRLLLELYADDYKTVGASEYYRPGLPSWFRLSSERYGNSISRLNADWRF